VSGREWLERAQVLARRGSTWLQETLIAPEWPMMALEVRPRSLGLVRLAREGQRLAVGSAAILELPEGAVSLSMTQPNIQNASASGSACRPFLSAPAPGTEGRSGWSCPTRWLALRFCLRPSWAAAAPRSTR
jgi:hypothetical protein